MSQSEKAQYYSALKNAGIDFDRHYRDYTTEELRNAYGHLTGDPDAKPPEDVVDVDPAELDAEEAPPSEFFGLNQQSTEPTPPPTPQLEGGEMAGQRQNQGGTDVVIRVDEEGREWYQEEIRKPAYPKPRGRRVLTYLETGVEEKQIKVGDYIETFEVAGSGPARTAEVKITLPSYQVGLFKDKRFPFRVHTYNEQQGFDLFEVQDFYGGAELVPAEVKRIYIQNVLCYDIRTTVRAIESEYRRLQLTGKVE